MNQLSPFHFESRDLRVQLDELGNPWFNANDVCEALEMGNARQAVESHVAEDDVQKLDTIDALGRTQQSNHVNESGLYALIFGSTKEAAKRFKRWVTAEVLPSIRKTGSYRPKPAQAPTLPGPVQDKVAALSLLHGILIDRVPGINKDLANTLLIATVDRETQMGLQDWQRLLPAKERDAPSFTLNATEIGKRPGVSAKAANLLLQTKGLQTKNSRKEWELTEDGAQWAQAVPFTRNGHSSYQILWREEVVQALQ